MKSFLKILFPIFFILSLSTQVNAQKKKDIIYEHASIGLSIVPTLHGGFLSMPNASADLKDSLRKADRLKNVLDFGAQFRFKTGRDWIVTTGIYYSNKGLTRVKEPVNFLDVIHDNMPEGKVKITDDMQGFTRQIYYKINYHFLEIPLLFGKDFTPKRMKNEEVRLSWFFGGSLDGLIKHDMKIEFRGFEPYGMSDYTLNKKETALKPFIVNMSAIIGARIDVDLYPKMRIYLQPNLRKQFFFASYGIEKHHLYSMSAEVGISYDVSTKRKDKTL
ncbi:MAG: outer membrane beta-barrel protein [Bacteroidia bacterium]|nr:outer membrane beta-barrel protein [Bacteroidia bacterium]